MSREVNNSEFPKEMTWGEFGNKLNKTAEQEMIFCVGLPASGKSAWAKLKVSMDKSYVRVSRDDLRLMRGIYWLPEQEDMISKLEMMCAAIAISEGKSVIIDATNLHEQRRIAFIDKVRMQVGSMGALSKAHFIVNMRKFDTSVEECIKRDAKRGDDKVGKKVILQMANRYGLETKYPEYRFTAGLPSAIICDLDGTLARNQSGRGFYDWSRVGEDGIDTEIRRMLWLYQDMGTKIIIMSGRDGICQPETEKWLGDNDIKWDRLLMRKIKDQRKDSIVKRELFEDFVQGQYNVLFALDDRNQVVDMWRKELGIKCLQVNYGDF